MFKIFQKQNRVNVIQDN